MKDNIGTGVVLGAFFPLVAYLLTNFTDLAIGLLTEKPISMYVLAAAINLIAVRFIYRSGREATVKGIVLITFIAMVIMALVLRGRF